MRDNKNYNEAMVKAECVAALANYEAAVRAAKETTPTWPGTPVSDLRFTPKRIKTIRKAHGLSQVQLSQLLGVTEWTICRWEQGQNQPQGVDVLERLLKLEVEMHEHNHREEDKESNASSWQR